MLVSALTASAAGEPQTRLFVTILQPASVDVSAVRGRAAAAAWTYPTVRLSVVDESTGATWRSLTCTGWCTFASLPPGQYRVVAESLDLRHRNVMTGIAVDDRRPVSIQIRWREGHHERAARDHVMPWHAPERPETRVSILRPDQDPWPIMDACRVGDAARLANPLFWADRGREGDHLFGVEFWGRDRTWWGALVGTVRDPAGRPAGGVLVTLEYLDVADRADTVFHTSVRTTPAGCYGLYGLWPGRYRVLVGGPSFAVAHEIEIPSDGLSGATIHDIALVAGPAARSASRPRVRPTVSTRLGAFASLDDLLRLVHQRESAIGGAGPDTALTARDTAIVEGVVACLSPDDWQAVYRVPDVSVVFEHEVSGDREVVTTDANGTYRFAIPAGRYRVSIRHPQFDPVVARVLVLPEGHAVLTSDDFNPASRSRVYLPGVRLRSGLMAALHFDLALHVAEVGDSTANTVIVKGRSLASVAAPLGIEFTRGTAHPQESLWTTPLTHHALAGRTVQAFHPLTPGVIYTEARDTLGQFTAVGQRRLANRLTIDGVSADLGIDIRPARGIGPAGSGALPAFATTGSTQTLVSVDAIETIGVLTTHVRAEHARTPGAQTTIVTRAGPDRFSGSVFADLRPEPLTATDFFDNAHGIQRRREFVGSGLSLGGPLPLPKTQYWVSYEQQKFDRSVVMTLPVPSLAMRDAAPRPLRPILEAFPRPNGPALSEDDYGPGLAEYSGEVPAASGLRVISGRVDTTVADRHRLALRLNHGRSRGDSASLDRQLPFVYTSTESTATTTATAMVTSMTSSFLHDLRLNVTHHAGSLVTGAPRYGGALAPSLDAFMPPGGTPANTWIRFNVFEGSNGGLNFGRQGGAAQLQFQVADAWTFLQGRHEWRVGGEYRHVVASTDQADNWYTYRFADVAEFSSGRMTRLLSLDRFGRARARLLTWSFFGQDVFRLSPRLTLEYGIRYSVKPAPRSVTDVEPWLVAFPTLPDLQPRPTGAPLWKTSWTDLATRAAMQYRFGSEARETTLRLGWSLTFDETTAPGAIAYGAGFPYRSRRILRPTSFPATPNELVASAPASFNESSLAEAYSFPTDLRSPRTQQWHVGVERALGADQRLAIGYVGTAARRLPYWHVFYADEGQTHLIHAVSDEASADYHALLTEYSRRLTNGLQARIAYTWSHAIDTDSGESESPNLPPTISPVFTNRASADFDRRHVLYAVISYGFRRPTWKHGLWALLADWQINAAVMMQSGAPLTIVEPRNIGRGDEILRPDLVPGAPLWIADSESPTGRRINTAAFITPTEARQGTLGRNTLRSSPLRQLDLSIVRSLRLGSTIARLRLDVFNVFNTPNFGPPENRRDLTDTPFGVPYQSYADAMGTGTLIRGGLAPMQQAGGARALQVSASLGW